MLPRTAFLCTLAGILAFLAFSATATAQGSDTVYDEADALTDSEEQNVQQAFDAAQEDTGQPLYVSLVPDTNVGGEAAQRELLDQERREENVPQDAGFIVVAPEDEWVRLDNLDGASEDEVYRTMIPDFGQGDFAGGLVTGAGQITGEPAVPQGNPDEGLPGGGFLLLLVAAVGGFLVFRNRRANRRRLEDERRAAEEEFAGLTTRLDEFDGKEKLVSGYLETQRPLLDQRTEEWVEEKISSARTAGFAQRFNEASSTLTSDPVSARRRMEEGRALLNGAVRELDEAEATMDDYRTADEALDGRLHEAREQISAAEEAEESARSEGVAVVRADLRPEYDRLARQAAARVASRDEFDPRESLAAVEALAERARNRRTALREEVAARDALPDERHATSGALSRARQTLEGYGAAYGSALDEYGPAALEDVPSPAELSASLLDAEGHVELAGRAASAGRFAAARSSLREASSLAGEAMRAPTRLKAATATADRKRREGEEKLDELEARLAQAKANEHLMNPHQRRRLREYESQLGDARYGFFAGDVFTALLLFEALDNDYTSVGDPAAGGDWGGGDFGGGDWGGGDFGGGDFGGGGF